MSRLPTAEDFLQDHLQISHFFNEKYEKMTCFSDDVQQAMVEFAKLHVEAALKEAAEKARVQMSNGYGVNEIIIYPNSLVDTAVITTNAASILNSYPLDNIK